MKHRVERSLQQGSLRPTLYAAWLRFRWPLVLLLVYLLAELLFVSIAADEGLFLAAVTGTGLGNLTLGLAVVLLRLLALALLPCLISYEIVMLAWDRLRSR